MGLLAEVLFLAVAGFAADLAFAAVTFELEAEAVACVPDPFEAAAVFFAAALGSDAFAAALLAEAVVVAFAGAFLAGAVDAGVLGFAAAEVTCAEVACVEAASSTVAFDAAGVAFAAVRFAAAERVREFVEVVFLLEADLLVLAVLRVLLVRFAINASYVLLEHSLFYMQRRPSGVFVTAFQTGTSAFFGR